MFKKITEKITRQIDTKAQRYLHTAQVTTLALFSLLCVSQWDVKAQKCDNNYTIVSQYDLSSTDKLLIAEDNAWMNKWFTSTVVSNDIEKIFIEEWMDAMTFSHINWVSREEFKQWNNYQNWKKIETPWEHEGSYSGNREWYRLSLPKDITIQELIPLIQQFSKKTNGKSEFNTHYDDLHNLRYITDAYYELQKVLEHALLWLKNMKSKTKNQDKQEKIQLLIERYQQYYEWENLRKEWNNFDTVFFEDNSYGRSLESIEKNKDVLGLERTLDALDKKIWKTVYIKFFESLFEYGTELLMRTDHLGDQIGLLWLREDLDIIKSITKDKDRIAKKEKEVLTKLNDFFVEYDFFAHEYGNAFSSSAPSQIQKDTNIMCVGGAWLCSKVLKHLDLSYSVFSLAGHVMIWVTLDNGENYLLDPYRVWKVISYQEIDHKNGWVKIKYTYQTGQGGSISMHTREEWIFPSKNADNALMFNILCNWSNGKVKSWKRNNTKNISYQDALYMSQLARELSKHNTKNDTEDINEESIVSYQLAKTHYKDWNYDKALVYINEALGNTPEMFGRYYELKSNICLHLWDQKWYKDNSLLAKKYKY